MASETQSQEAPQRGSLALGKTRCCYQDSQESTQQETQASCQQLCGESPWTWLLQRIELAEAAILATVWTATS